MQELFMLLCGLLLAVVVLSGVSILFMGICAAVAHFQQRRKFQRHPKYIKLP